MHLCLTATCRGLPSHLDSKVKLLATLGCLSNPEDVQIIVGTAEGPVLMVDRCLMRESPQFFWHLDWGHGATW